MHHTALSYSYQPRLLTCSKSPQLLIILCVGLFFTYSAVRTGCHLPCSKAKFSCRPILRHLNCITPPTIELVDYVPDNIVNFKG
jgi:hypothetical protein